MNWRKIQKKYSKAFAFLIRKEMDGSEPSNIIIEFYDDEYFRYSCTIKGIDNGGHGDMFTRQLYDFFDENGIPITINADYYGSMEYHPLTYSEDKADIYYWLNVNFAYEDNIEYKTRVEAESAAFEKAFEILENLITTQ